MSTKFMKHAFISVIGLFGSIPERSGSTRPARRPSASRRRWPPALVPWGRRDAPPPGCALIGCLRCQSPGWEPPPVRRSLLRPLPPVEPEKRSEFHKTPGLLS